MNESEVPRDFRRELIEMMSGSGYYRYSASDEEIDREYKNKLETMQRITQLYTKWRESVDREKKLAEARELAEASASANAAILKKAIKEAIAECLAELGEKE